MATAMKQMAERAARHAKDEAPLNDPLSRPGAGLPTTQE
jgi:hypothetical protein